MTEQCHVDYVATARDESTFTDAADSGEDIRRVEDPVE